MAKSGEQIHVEDVNGTLLDSFPLGDFGRWIHNNWGRNRAVNLTLKLSHNGRILVVLVTDNSSEPEDNEVEPVGISRTEMDELWNQFEEHKNQMADHLAGITAQISTVMEMYSSLRRELTGKIVAHTNSGHNEGSGNPPVIGTIADGPDTP